MIMELNRPNWLGSETGIVKKTVTVTETSAIYTTENDRKIIKSGTLISDTTLGYGLLINDADITDGAKVAQVMIRGTYIDSKLPSSVSASKGLLKRQGLFAIEFADVKIPESTVVTIPFGTAIKFNDTIAFPLDITEIDIEATSDYSVVSYIAKIKFSDRAMSYNDGNNDYAVYSNGKWVNETAKTIVAVSEYGVKSESEKQWWLANTNLIEIDDRTLTPPPTLNDLSWAKISELSANGKAKEIFSVGDEKEVELTTSEKITMVIMGFEHDDLTSGGKAGITFAMKDLLSTTYPMNSAGTNVGGWEQCSMRTSTMPTLLSQLPTDLQGVIKPVLKKTTSGNEATTITTSSDKLWLFSEVEIDNIADLGYADEGEQYEYWKTVKDGTVQINRVKKRNGAGFYWWLRSPNVSTYSLFLCVAHTGGVGGYNVNSSYGVSFGFCV